MHKSPILLLGAMALSLGACKTPAQTAPTKVASAAPAAAPAATPPQAAAAATPNDPNQIICVREEVTGTRLPPMKECHTRAEWAARKADGNERMQLLNAGPNAGAMRGNGQ